MYIKQILLTTALFIISFAADAQSNKEKAQDLGNRAVKLEDEGKHDEAMILLNEAQTLDPDNYVYSYEIAYCYQAKEDYKSGITVMLRVMNMQGVNEDCYQMLGNLYDMAGDSVMAFSTYAAGLKKFPDAGRLYLETGNMYFTREQYGKALPYYEKGIEVDPTYPSNYYRAAQLYTSSTEAMWGMIYGEIFMNLERNTERTGNMSKWLYEAYKKNIVIYSKDSASVHFCRNMTMSLDDIKDPKKMRLPYSMIYEPLLLTSLINVDTINTESLCRIRKNFTEQYHSRKYDKTRPNVLFDYMRTVENAGHLDAYNHWILINTDDDSFAKWQKDHEKEWKAFAAWFTENKIKITKENAFVKSKA